LFISVENSEGTTFWLIQERKEYLYFQWIPFQREYYGALFLEQEDDVSRQMTDDLEEAMLMTVAPACKNQKYSLRQSVGYAIAGYYDKESRELNFNRKDLIIIFKKDSTGFHRMYTISANERNYHFTNGLHDDEHVIITTYHEHAFGLSELGKEDKNIGIIAADLIRLADYLPYFASSSFHICTRTTFVKNDAVQGLLLPLMNVKTTVTLFGVVYICWNATLALPILAFTSASEPPCSSMMLPRCRGPHNPVEHQKEEEGRE
uniref:ER membrane protein complex subunit 1 n=1 Tax=Schistosoma curassoni TaxID=6186 RepID=A0A183K736_9TREM